MMKKMSIIENTKSGDLAKIPAFRIFTILLASFIAGVFVASFFDLVFYQIYLYIIIFSLVITAGVFIFKKYIIKIISIGAIFFFVGFLLFNFVNTRLNNLPILPSEEIEFSGIVVSYPDISSNSQSFFFQTSDFGRERKIYVSTSEFPNYNYGDILKIKTKIIKPTNISNFDWVDYLKRYGTVAQTDKNSEITLVSNAGGNKLLKKLYSIRREFEKTVEKTLPEPESSLGIGILIGDKSGFGKDLLNDFSRIGITHIIALSGYNITIIIIFLTDILLGFLTRRQIFVISIILILLFIAMTGAAPSVIRAAIITLLVAYGKTIGRKADMTNLILLSATVMVAINPFILKFDVGFQLSFLAFAGLIYFSPILDKIFSKKVFKFLPIFAKSAFIETLSAQIFVLPIILSSFGIISIIAPLTNVLILPTIPATMFFIFLSTLIYWFIPAIGQLAFLITYLPLKFVIVVTQYFARLPISALQISNNWQTTIIIIYVLAVFGIIFKNQKTNDQKVN